MLFTDSDLITAQDLSAIDGEVDDVVKSMEATLSGDRSLIRQAWSECANQLRAHMQVYTSYVAPPGFTPGHMAAVFAGGIPSVTMPRTSLHSVVAHNWQFDNALSSIQLWLAYTALRVVYQDASNRLGKDRYEEKMTLFSSRANQAWSAMKASGLPTVFKPFPAPAALHGFNAGSFTVSTATATGAVGGSFWVALTYYDSSVYQSVTAKGNAESGPSPYQLIMPAADQGISIDITGLNPPNGTTPNVGISEGYISPYNATHWSIYVAADNKGQPGTFYYQTSLPIATKTCTFTADPILSGVMMQQGQYPDRNLVFGQNVAMRG